MKNCLLEKNDSSFPIRPSLRPLQHILLFIFSLWTSALCAQQVVSGKVFSGDSVLSGVSVTVKGSGIATQTDRNGTFTISATPSSTLTFSFVGYTTQDVKVGGKSFLTVQMQTNSQQLGDVVVIGYGTQRKKDVTGAVSTVKASELDHTNAVSINNLLQGKAAGLNIITPTAQPGGGIAVNIRGALSPRGSNAPLYVIDGVPITNNNPTDNFGNGQTGFWGGTNRDPLNTINPNDIESIDVLKDASASAIYGAAAANGVILITTKRGREGKPSVSYSGSYSLQTPRDYLQPLNASEFMKYHNLFGEEYYKLLNNLPPYGTVDPSTVTPYQPMFSADAIASAGAGTNWVDYLLQQGTINDQNIAISAGTAATKAYASFNYFDHQGLLKGTGLQRFSGRVNLDQKIGSRILFKMGVMYSQIDNKNQNTGQQGDPDSPSPLQSALRYSPTFGPYDSNGNLTHSYLIRTPNPQSWLMINNTTSTKRLLFTPSLEINIVNGLKATIVEGVDQNHSEHNLYVPVAAKFQTALAGDAQLGTNNINNYSTEGYLTYSKRWNKSNLSAVAGGGYYKTNADNFGLEGLGFFTDAFGSANVAIAANRDQNAIYSGKSERTKLSQFVRLNYSILDRYILTFNARRDGSSGFAPNKKWGTFPGISAGWVVSEEPFMKNSSAGNLLKLRVGYGSTGNESIVVNGNYAYSLYGTAYGWQYPFGNPSQMSTGILQTQIGNPNLSWETDLTSNVGVDFGFLKNRISGSVDYYVRTAKDLLDFLRLPSNNAIGQEAANVGSTRSRGLEIALRGQVIQHHDFTWSSNLVFNTYKSYWLQRNPENMALNPWEQPHDPIHAVYGWRTAGIIRDPKDIPSYQTGSYIGNIKYLDLNNDGKLDIKDVTYLGNTDPKASYGFGNTFTFKGFDLNVFLNGTLGGLQWDNWQKIGQVGGSVGIQNAAPSNAEIHALNTWSTFNTNGTYPGIAPDKAAANNPTGLNDYGVRLVNFCRVKNITIGYNLPAKWLGERKVFRSIRLYVDLENMFVFGNYSGIDPEMEQYNFPYPVARTTALGVNLQF